MGWGPAPVLVAVIVLDRFFVNLPVSNAQLSDTFFLQWRSVACLEPRAAGGGHADSGCRYQAMNTTDLWPTVLSHPPCPVSPDHADVHWPGHWAQELKQLKDSQRCSSCALIMLPLYVAKIL